MRRHTVLTQELLSLSAATRAMQMWFQAAHHLTKGAGFAGDHAILYDEIYNSASDEFDAYVERNLGLSNDEQVASPRVLMPLVTGLCMEYPLLANKPAHVIAQGALVVMRHHLERIARCYHAAKEAGQITLGVDDLLMANANTNERFVYLLQQRAKMRT